MPKKNGPQIHAEDLASKFAIQFFSSELLHYFGIHMKAERAAPTEYVHLELKQMSEDFNFLMENGDWYHFEFESDGVTQKDLRRFRSYDAITSQIHEVPVITYVICSAKVKKPLSCLREGINPYRVRIIRLKDRSAEQLFERLKSIPEAQMHKKDLLPVVLVPLMDSKISQSERAMQGFAFLKKSWQHISKEDIRRMQAVLYVLSCKFLTEEEKMRLKEFIATDFLTQLFIEDGKALGREEGREEGKTEGEALGQAKSILFLLKDIGPVTPALSDRVICERDESMLQKWLKLAASAGSIEEFEKAM